ncbi:2959_t:CDS:2 [Ambispora gerdemannii]|uniref:2959_t:CDS:1 n=1 Tax=Ambispora gerdemannii TaxID=144530 RepID=A0A9N8WI64_9GLOM|nr:2959_t:CDS:2 [Ambispora gerdemannii]
MKYFPVYYPSEGCGWFGNLDINRVFQSHRLVYGVASETLLTSSSAGSLLTLKYSSYHLLILIISTEKLIPKRSARCLPDPTADSANALFLRPMNWVKKVIIQNEAYNEQKPAVATDLSNSTWVETKYLGVMGVEQ